MRFIFVRHGEPNYELDCLTDAGHRQAQAAAERLCGEGIREIYASSSGRAFETASYTAAKLGLPVTTFDFIREIPAPWQEGPQMIEGGKHLVADDDHKYEAYYQTVANGIDGWLERFGLVREGLYYRCTQDCNTTVAMFSHGGASSAVFAHLFNLSLPFVCATLHQNYTAITTLLFAPKVGYLVAPRIEIMGDARHIDVPNVNPFYGV